MIRFLAHAVTMIAVAGPVLAQEVVGRSVIDGRPVELLEDGTWSYADTADLDAGCAPLRNGISFCGGTFGWDEVPAGSPDITAQYRLDDRTYGIVIVEGVGINQGVSSEFMREMVIELAAGRTGVSASQVPVLDQTAGTVDKQPVDTIAYLVTLSGTPLVFINSILVADEITVQFVTYSFGRELTDRDSEIHDIFTDYIRIDG